MTSLLIPDFAILASTVECRRILHAGNTSDTHRSPHRGDDDDDANDDDGGDGRLFTLDFNLGTINRRRHVHTRLVASMLNLRKKLTHAHNGR